MLTVSIPEKGFSAFSFTEKMASSLYSLTGYIGREILYLAICATEGRTYTADEISDLDDVITPKENNGIHRL
jgi:hypothetical protein